MNEKKLDFFELQNMTFEKPDTETFYGLKLAYEALRSGGNVPTIYNAANEKAVALFLEKKISYLQIPEMIERSMSKINRIDNPDVEQILETESRVYEYISGLV